MTREKLYDFVTSLCGGEEIDITLFNTFLDVAQMRIEGLRPWVWLRATDSSQTVSPADNYTTAKDLGDNFFEWYEEAPLQLIDVNGNPSYLTEVPFSQRFQYQKMGGKFCVDYPNNNIYILGTITQAYTLYQNYIKNSELVSGDDNNEWIFPEKFHKILGLLLAIFWRKGVDYDVFNQTQADNQEQQVLAIYDVMSRWDSNLQANMQRGKDPFDNFSIGSGSQNGGFVTM